ncbi:FAD-dependent oxidoreductase [Natronoarchaeum mannanilyticum]|uniref:FAD-dependent oxidoreductase n=1 Tax=Natronoarchaeum mannanilyticum TaxID=926360 RepID=A0AAV3TEG9_9EURY
MGASPASAETSVSTDVAIVGAGIAGTALAYLLARSGVDVVLAERHTDLSREFRGFGFQPLALQYFDRMDLLEKVYALDPVRIRRPHVHAFGKRYAIADLSTYSDIYDHVVFMEQPPLLRLLIDEAEHYATFEYRDGTPVTGLLTERDRIVGVRATDRATTRGLDVRADVVVAADGRYSTVRDELGLGANRFESDVELVWVKLPDSTAAEPVDVYINEHGVLANFGLPGGEVQLGLPIEAGTYPDIRAQGPDAFAARLAAIAPGYRETIETHFTGFEQCSLLRIAPGITENWTRDGLVLIGDAAHVASPFGGQGNLMALKDAVALHPILADALAERDEGTPLSEGALRGFERTRRPQVEATVRLQRRMGGGIGWIARNSDALPPTAFRLLFRALFTLGEPIMRDTVRHMLFGDDPPSVARSYFAAAPESCE